MARGGARLNTGPAKGSKQAKTLSREEMKILWREMARESLRGVLASQIKLCLEGDTAAIKEFNERLMGKVTEEVDVTSKGERITAINMILPNGAELETDTKAVPGIQSPS
jgi:hypothetical protein